MSSLTNLKCRLKLLKLALFKRFVYDDIDRIAVARGLKHSDIIGTVGPLELIAKLRANPVDRPVPDFSRLRTEELIIEHGWTVNWSSEPSVARFMGQLAYACRATTVLEIGCFIGWTTAHIATALRSVGGSARVHYLDYDEETLARATAALSRTGLADWGVPHHGGSLDPVVQAKLPRHADIIFIDTTHDYEQTRDEIHYYTGHLAPGGCLVLHDAIRYPGVRRAIHEGQGRFDICTFATERGNGVSVLIPKAG